MFRLRTKSKLLYTAPTSTSMIDIKIKGKIVYFSYRRGDRKSWRQMTEVERAAELLILNEEDVRKGEQFKSSM